MSLSIITINLNNRNGLQRTFDIVVGQTFTDYEWIVIDGGNTSTKIRKKHRINHYTADCVKIRSLLCKTLENI